MTGSLSLDGQIFDAVTLDVGGVFVVPDHDRLDRALTDAGLPVSRDRFWAAHYRAMHAVDAANSDPEYFGDYVPAFCHHVGYRSADHDRAADALAPLFGPSGLWCEPIPDSIRALRSLAEAGLPLAVVSNADGTVADVLRDTGVCQAGPGPLVPVRVVIDSGCVGVAKPDPAIFRFALEALGTPPDRTLHVGDSVHYDIVGARAAGMPAAHFDPMGLCAATDHLHLRSLAELGH